MSEERLSDDERQLICVSLAISVTHADDDHLQKSLVALLKKLEGVDKVVFVRS